MFEYKIEHQIRISNPHKNLNILQVDGGSIWTFKHINMIESLNAYLFASSQLYNILTF